MVNNLYNTEVTSEIMRLRHSGDKKVDEVRRAKVAQIAEVFGDSALLHLAGAVVSLEDEERIALLARDDSRNRLVGVSYLTRNDEGLDLMVGFRGLSFDELEAVARSAAHHFGKFVNVDQLWDFEDQMMDGREQVETVQPDTPGQQLVAA